MGAVVLGAACSNDAGDSPSAAAVVERVVDGDTVRVSVDGGSETVRLLGIDTPESVAPNQPVECFGLEASARLAELLPQGQAVTIETDPTQDGRDRYDRLLGYVFPAGGEATRSANEALVASGHARVFVYDDEPFQAAEQFMAAEAAARADARGLWGECDGDEPAARAAEGGGACDPGYRSCVPPAPPDLDCADLEGPVEVIGDDPHRLDGDGDGFACN